MELILENVRCFCKRQTVPVRPLTLLVGENSSGKSTFLAMLAHASQQSFPSLRPSFHVPPFDLGTYDSIATYKGGRFGRRDSFTVGVREGNGAQKRTLLATYRSYKGQPQLCRLVAILAQQKIDVEITAVPYTAKVTLSGPKHRKKPITLALKGRFPLEADMPLAFLFRNLLIEHRTVNPRDAERIFFELISVARQLGPPAIALAPVRTKPKRTYDVISDEFTPEGDHIPVVLARVWQGEDDSERQRFLKALTEFGVRSSLFEKIDVKRFGKRPTDPFQILVSTEGPAANLLDVGYGVSQALPVIVQSVLAGRHGKVQLLFQQPEVHLHPRAQAELGTFFAKLVADTRTQTVIETHSDYLLDRIRLEVSNGVIAPNNVVILYFERKDAETKIHPIYLDRHGNVKSPPESYRRFFLQEEMALLTRLNR